MTDEEIATTVHELEKLPPEIEALLVRKVLYWMKIVGSVVVVVTAGAWTLIAFSFGATSSLEAEQRANRALDGLDARLSSIQDQVIQNSEEAQQLLMTMNASLVRTQIISENAEILSRDASELASSATANVAIISSAARDIESLRNVTDIANEVARSESVRFQINAAIEANFARVEPVPIGTIVSSIIEPDAFLDVNPGYALADGSVVDPVSAFARFYGQNVLPDLRGMFLRGMNAGRDDQYADPDSSRIAGSLQSEEVGNHTHSIALVTNGWPDSSGDRTRNGAPYYLLHPSQNGARGQLQTDTGQGRETRPVNVSVFYYVKVD